MGKNVSSDMPHLVSALGHEDDAVQLIGTTLLTEITHEFRTPLAGVLGMLEMLLDSRLDETQRDAVMTAHASAEDVLSIFSNAVDLPMIEIGALALHERPFDLNRELDACVESLRAYARLRGAELAFSYNPDSPLTLVTGDAERIRQALANLVKYLIRQGGKTIGLDIQHWPDLDGTVMLSVKAETLKPASMPEGSAEESPQIGAPGRQFDAAELGLIVTKKLAEMMGGELVVDYDDQGHISATVHMTVMQAPNVLEGIRVLMAGETAERRSLLQAVLSVQGMRVDCANTAAEALDALTKAVESGDPYGAVLLDQHLKGVDGEMFGNAVISEPAHRAMHTVLMSDADPHRAERAGFSALLSKPVAPQAMVDTMVLLWGTSKTGHRPPFVVDGVVRTPAKAGMPFAGARVLVVDDNPVNQRIARHTLEQLGCVVELADDGRQAVARHTNGNLDLILMDCEMPVMDGYEAVRQIRAAEKPGTRTAIVAWTARGSLNEPRRSLDAGFDDFLAKPMRRSDLHRLLGTWLKRSEQEETFSSQADEFEELMQTFGEGFAELVDLFRNDSPKRITAMKIAAAEMDAPQLAKISHAFCGSTASIGAVRLSSMCKDLESRARKGLLEDVDIRLAAIEKEYERVHIRLRALLSSHVHSG